MVQLISEFLGAGTGTAVATLEWALAHLVDKPKMQEKLRGEVDDGEVSCAGAGMPYLHAVVLETLRMHPPLPVILRHIHADVVVVLVGGMAVPPPAGRLLREFLCEGHWQGQQDMEGSRRVHARAVPGRWRRGGRRPIAGAQADQDDAIAGHRFCPGVGMTMVNMKSLLAALVREFEWAVPTGTSTIDLTELDSFFKVMKKPLSARVTRTHQIHLKIS
ncbi:unnamed protein product [Triticum turgidum subsp. durum]|uniref:Cytochrome P450 n=1 Tax=Triticum turgidum subsp. durum TaxID=4567 RepID=A0A9R1PBC2_TRITD|nr:unnamed protein product [Triticum turgidum subsp. durum]